MHNTITSEIVVAYSQCPRKAFLLLCTEEQGTPHEYLRILEQQKKRNQISYLHTQNQTSSEQEPHIVNDLNDKGDIIIQATLRARDLEAYCDVLTQVESSSALEDPSYEPTIVTGTYSVSKEQEL